jgi:type II secretory pathway pseudopilin PulG
MTVMTIMGILVMSVAIPYMYYQNKGKVRIASREIAQSFYEARNMAINGYSSGITNQSIGIYFDAESSRDRIIYFSYPYTLS